MDLFLDLVEVLRHETKPAVIAVCRSPGSEPTIVTLTLRCWDGPGRNFHFADCRSGGSVAVRERDGSRTLWPSSLGSQLKQPGNIKCKEREISLPQLPTNQGDTPLHVIIKNDIRSTLYKTKVTQLPATVSGLRTDRATWGSALP